MGFPLSGNPIKMAQLAFLLFTALFAVDAGFGGLDVTHGALWTGLAGLAFVILHPHRVSVRPGLLSARGLLVTDTVRTDSLVSVLWSDGVAQRLVLRDTEGSRVEIDPAVLVRNPAMWRRLDTDTRASIQRGTLPCLPGPTPSGQSRTAVASISTRCSGTSSAATPISVAGGTGATPSFPIARVTPSISKRILSGVQSTT